MSHRIKTNVKLIIIIMISVCIPGVIHADFTVEGNWNVTNSYWCGPLVVDVDNDGEKEIIITDATSIRIYSPDGGDPIRTINLPQALINAGYKFRSIPSAGQLNDNENLEIVASCVNDEGVIVDDVEVYCDDPPEAAFDTTALCDYYSDLSRLLIWDALTGTLLAQTDDDFVTTVSSSENYPRPFFIFAGNRDWVIGVDKEISPNDYQISLKAYPNPFNDKVTINYNTSNLGKVFLRIYDIKGRLLQTLEDRHIVRGCHRLTWKSETAGIYFVVLNAGGIRKVRKVVCVK